MQKYSDLSHLLDTLKLKLLTHRSEGYDIKWKAEYTSLSQVLGSDRRKNPPCNAKDNLRARHLVIEGWFGG